MPESTSASPVSATEADWSRERRATFWQPSRALLAALRDYQRVAPKKDPLSQIRRRIAVLRHRFWSVVCAADIPINSTLGGGLMLPHPTGIVLHPAAKVGVNCLLFQQVTLGAGSKPGLPVLGGHVDVGAGAKILGGVTIGDHARIGANAVVVDDVPAGATAIGIPARIIPAKT